MPVCLGRKVIGDPGWMDGVNTISAEDVTWLEREALEEEAVFALNALFPKQ